MTDQGFYDSQENLALTYRNDINEFKRRLEGILAERKEKFGEDSIYLGRTYLRMAGVFRAHNNEKDYGLYLKKYQEILNKNKGGKTPKDFKISCYHEVINQCMMRIMDDKEVEKGIEALQNVNKLLDPKEEAREVIENNISIAMLRMQLEQYEASIKVSKEVLKLAKNNEVVKGSLLEIYRMLLHANSEIGESQQAENAQKVLSILEKDNRFWIANFNPSS